MTETRPQRVLDPVCGMTVDVAAAESAGLTVEHEGRSYGFCRAGCLRAFREEPGLYAARAQEAHAISLPRSEGLPVIDEGMRLWYESCSCCLSDAFPDIKAALDAERATAEAKPVEPGICEIAEAEQPVAPRSM